MLTQERLKELLHYDPDTGVFTWKMPVRGRHVGSVAGGLSSNGYVRIKIDGAYYRAHRLAFLYVNGSFPPAYVDHLDHSRTNNRWSNLRPATGSENQKNTRIRSDNTSGFKGVHYDASSGAWMASAMLNSKTHYLGLYPTPEAASAAYQAFARKHHGEFYHPTRTGMEAV